MHGRLDWDSKQAKVYRTGISKPGTSEKTMGNPSVPLDNATLTTNAAKPIRACINKSWTLELMWQPNVSDSNDQSKRGPKLTRLTK